MRSEKRSRFVQLRTYPLVLGLLVLVPLTVFVFSKLHHSSHIGIPSPNPVSINTDIGSSKSNGSTNNSQGDVANSKNQSPSPSPAETSAGATPVTPSGTFVSNHSITLSNPGTLAEVSVCNTTSGATCTIQFSQGTTTRTLAAQTTDGSGNTSWNWNAGSANLTTGNWKVTAVAKLGDKTSSTEDTRGLAVQP